MIIRKSLTPEQKRVVRSLANSAAESLRDLKNIRYPGGTAYEWHCGFYRGLALAYTLAARNVAATFKHNCL